MTGTFSYFQRALTCLTQRRISDALASLDEAERAGGDANECAGRRWECLMLLGRYEEAWRQSERISASGTPDPNALWDGAPFRGKRVIVRCLHGFGDAIQFIRYTEPLRQEASQVVVQTHPELASIMGCLPYVDRAITWREEDPALWEQQIEVMELPRAFGATLANIPCRVPYLSVPESVRASSRVLRGDRLRIGLQWAGGPWNPARSISLRTIEPLLGFRDCEYFSFQRGEGRNDLGSPLYSHILDVSGDSPDIIHAAADLLNIDLLITVDTMLAHLAGALGRPVWVLLPFQADWRWLLDRADSPWYPTMRLFRQAGEGDWDSAIACMARSLEEWLRKSSNTK